jgi:hypothetical protein
VSGFGQRCHPSLVPTEASRIGHTCARKLLTLCVKCNRAPGASSVSLPSRTACHSFCEVGESKNHIGDGQEAPGGPLIGARYQALLPSAATCLLPAVSSGWA